MNTKSKGVIKRSSISFSPIYVLIAIGILDFGIFIYGNFLWKTNVQKTTPLLDNVARAKVYVSSGHLWFEELMGGDKTVTMEYVLELLYDAIHALDDALEGNSNIERIEGKPVIDLKLMNQIKQMKTLVHKFIDMGNERFRMHDVSGIGSQIDQRFDELFREVLYNADVIDKLVHLQISDGLRRMRLIQIIILSSWGIIVSGTGGVLFVNNRKRRRAEEALMKAKEGLEDRVEERTAELKTSLREREVLFKEVHHRVKNNMQVIVSLLRMQSRRINNKQYVDMFKDCQSRIESMSLVHERLYQSKDLSKINFGDYIENLTASLFHSYGINMGKIALKIDVADVLLGVDTAIPCGLIINELITNGLKYAFPGDKKGEILISLGRIVDLGLRNEDLKSEIQDLKSEMIELIVSDNGIGIPENIDLRNTKSLGLQLVFGMVENQLGGTIEVDRANGTTVQIRFKGKRAL